MSSRVTFDDKHLENINESGNTTPRLSAPIDIPNTSSQFPAKGDSNRGRRRRRAASTSSVSSQSADSPTPATPPNGSSPTAGEDDASPVDIAATSPILSYFLSHASPIKHRHFSFKKSRKPSNGSPGAEDEEDVPTTTDLPHVLHHSRRLSHSWHNTGTIGIPQKGPITESQQERHNSLMRRLSIGASLSSRPSLPLDGSNFNPLIRVTTEPVPIHTNHFPLQSPPEIKAPAPRRVSTLSSPAAQKAHRAPSPMGERMLKGDFHGF